MAGQKGNLPAQKASYNKFKPVIRKQNLPPSPQSQPKDLFRDELGNTFSTHTKSRKRDASADQSEDAAASQQKDDEVVTRSPSRKVSAVFAGHLTLQD